MTTADLTALIDEAERLDRVAVPPPRTLLPQLAAALRDEMARAEQTAGWLSPAELLDLRERCAETVAERLPGVEEHLMAHIKLDDIAGAIEKLPLRGQGKEEK